MKSMSKKHNLTLALMALAGAGMLEQPKNKPERTPRSAAESSERIKSAMNKRAKKAAKRAKVAARRAEQLAASPGN